MADQKITQLNANTTPATTDILPMVDDPSGTPATQKITLANLLKVVNGLTADTAPDAAADYLLSYDTSASAAKKVLVSKVATGLTNSNISPTTTNVTAAVNTRYFADVSGLTADRNFVVPAGAVGDTIELNIKVGDDTYELVIIGDTSITINGGSAATEWSRLFITGESIKLVADTTSNWQVIEDHRIPCYSKMDRITSNANTTHLAATEITADWNNIVVDRGNIADLTNDRFNLRRANDYELTFAFRPAASVTDQKYIALHVYGGATGATQYGYAINRVAATGSAALINLANVRVVGAVADQVVAKFSAEEANIGMLKNDVGSGQTGASWVQLKEIL